MRQRLSLLCRRDSDTKQIRGDTCTSWDDTGRLDVWRLWLSPLSLHRNSGAFQFSGCTGNQFFSPKEKFFWLSELLKHSSVLYFVMTFSCDHSGALIHATVIQTGFSHSSAVTVARHDFVRQSPFVGEKTYIPCKGNDYQRTAKEACRHLRMGRMRRHWGEWYSHCYAPMFPARIVDNCIFL